jgi:hypothetical protein
MSRARQIVPDEAAFLEEARNYVRVKLCGNQKLAHAWRKLHRAYAAMIRRENGEAGVTPSRRMRRVA